VRWWRPVGEPVSDTDEDGDGPLDESEQRTRAESGVEGEGVQRGRLPSIWVSPRLVAALRVAVQNASWWRL